jgi:hypothetical protein
MPPRTQLCVELHLDALNSGTNMHQNMDQDSPILKFNLGWGKSLGVNMHILPIVSAVRDNLFVPVRHDLERHLILQFGGTVWSPT